MKIKFNSLQAGILALLLTFTVAYAEEMTPPATSPTETTETPAPAKKEKKKKKEKKEKTAE